MTDTDGDGLTDPHTNDFCVVCKRGPDCGETMFPVAIKNGYVCGKCITSAASELPWGANDR